MRRSAGDSELLQSGRHSFSHLADLRPVGHLHLSLVPVTEQLNITDGPTEDSKMAKSSCSTGRSVEESLKYDKHVSPSRLETLEYIKMSHKSCNNDTISLTGRSHQKRLELPFIFNVSWRR